MENLNLNQHFLFFSLGRHAFYEALKLGGVQKGDSVFLPELNCNEVLSAINLIGAKPSYYPVNDKLEVVSLPQNKTIKAVVAINYFGFPQPMEVFRNYCSRTGAILIEDNAHGFLSRSVTGEFLGTRGDFGIFSFRKTIYLADGGGLYSKISKRENHLLCDDSPLPIEYKIKKSFSSLQQTTGIRFRSGAEAVIRALRKIRTGYSLPQPDPEMEWYMPPVLPMRCRSLEILKSVDQTNEIRRRRELFFRFQGELKNEEIQPVYSELPEGTAPYGFPFYSRKESVQKIIAKSRKLGYDCIPWQLSSATSPFKGDHYYKLWFVNFMQ